MYKTRNSNISIFFLLIATILSTGVLASCTRDKRQDEDAIILKSKADRAYENQEYAEALELYIETMDMAWKSGNKKLYLTAVCDIAMIHDALGDSGRAMFYYKKALDGIEAENFTDMKASLLPIMVVCCINGGLVDEAKIYYEKQKKTEMSDEATRNYFLLLNKALIEKEEENYKSSFETLGTLLEKMEETGMGDHEKTPIVIELGAVAEKMNDPEKAFAYYNRGLEMASREGLDGYKADACEALTRLYDKRGDQETALYYSELCREIHDTLYNTRRMNNALIAMEKTEEFHTAETINHLNHRMVQLWVVIIVVGVLLVVLFISLIVIVRINRSRREAYKALVAQINMQDARDKETRELRDRFLRAVPVHDAIEDNESDSADERAIRTERLLKKIMDTMNRPEFLYNPEFNLNLLCREAGSNSKYVSSAINTYYGKNFRQLLNELRIKEAVRRLNVKERKIQELADELGYGSTNSFISAFKAIVGMTPARYRQTVRLNGGIAPGKDIEEDGNQQLKS